MANLKTILEKIQKMEKFIDRDGNEWALLNAEFNDDCLVAEFIPYHMASDDSWQEHDVQSLVVEFEPQQIEMVSGYEYPRFSCRYVEYDDPAFDRDLAIAVAFDQAVEYLRERRVSNAA